MSTKEGAGALYDLAILKIGFFSSVNHMMQKLDLFVEVMASANCSSSSSSLGKRKQRNDFSSTKLQVVVTEDSEGGKTQIPIVLAPIRVNSSCRSETEDKFEAEKDDDEEEELFCVTPKSEEHKISSMKVCPPAPRKPKSAPLKRNPAIISSCRRAIHFPSDSPDLDLLFGSDLTKDQQHQKKKKPKRKESSSSVKEESQN